MTYGQAIARIAAANILVNRWGQGSVGEALLKAVKDQIGVKLEHEIAKGDMSQLDRVRLRAKGRSLD